MCKYPHNTNVMNKTEYENFKPYYYLDTGEDNIMYTLKHAQIDWGFIDGVQKPYIRKLYIKNLSIDYQEAVKKAKEYVGDELLYLNGERQTDEWGSGNSNKGDRYVTELTEEQKEQQEKIRLAQEEVAKKEKEAYEKAEPVPTEYERIKIEGLVLACYERETQWGRAVKNIIQDDRGFKVCGTAVADRDERVSFMARIEPSKDDPKFGFYKRPTKIELIS